jgi:hypothetical protein
VKKETSENMQVDFVQNKNDILLNCETCLDYLFDTVKHRDELLSMYKEAEAFFLLTEKDLTDGFPYLKREFLKRTKTFIFPVEFIGILNNTMGLHNWYETDEEYPSESECFEAMKQLSEVRVVSLDLLADMENMDDAITYEVKNLLAF